MAKGRRVLFCFFFFVFFTLVQWGEGVERSHGRGTDLKLFVFGDSYVDTGNFRKSLASSWKEPYGVTFPGKPSGRWSDGRVMTDFLASQVGIRSPLPYKWRKIGPKPRQHGMNFAYGGTGVFDTPVQAPNLTAQIGLLQGLVSEGMFTRLDVESSIAVVCVAGNDYTAYQARNGTIQGVRPFVASLINQLALNLKQLQEIGVRKIAVTAISPLGCLPSATSTWSYQQCNETLNQVSSFHNTLLRQAVEQINNQTSNASSIAIIDLYTAFMSVIQSSKGQGVEGNILKPCCVGIGSGNNCGSVDGNGTKLYSICDDPKSAFFWDRVHPTQAGWAAISSFLGITVDQLY